MFYILRCLDVDLCERLKIPIKFAFENFNKDDEDNILDKNKLVAKFYIEKYPDCFVRYLIENFKFKPIKHFNLKTAA